MGCVESAGITTGLDAAERKRRRLSFRETAAAERVGLGATGGSGFVGRVAQFREGPPCTNGEARDP